jgi:trimeric autotransporter adhesin
MNLAYVLDIPLPEVGEWGMEHGFTADELAWIQPGYPATDPWIAFGGGTDAPVTTLLKLSNGDLLVAGEFTQAGGANHMHVARWDGSTYQPLGAGVDGTIECAIEQAGVIMVGGTFQSGSTDAAIWNGTTWTYISVFPGMDPAVHAFHIHNNELYAAGTASGFAGTDNRVSKLVGLAWESIDGNMNNTIHTMASFNGELVIGGAFTGLWSFGNPDSSLMHVARHDGNAWVQYADGLNATVRDLEVFDGQLHAGGDLYENIAPVFGLARIAAGANTWEQLMPNLSMYIFPGVGPTYLSCLYATDAALYLGGAFSIASGLSYGSNIAVFHGQVDGFTPSATFDAPIRALAMLGTRLVAGGDMLTANGAQVDHIAELELATSIEELPANIELSLWPNPVETSATVSVGQPVSPDTWYELTDPTGRVVASERVTTQRFAVDAGALAAGAYTLRVGDGTRTGTMTIVKE